MYQRRPEFYLLPEFTVCCKMVLPRGIEPRSPALQTGAMTTSAKAAFLAEAVRLELTHPLLGPLFSRQLPLCRFG